MLLVNIKRIYDLNSISRHVLISGVRFTSGNIKNEIRLKINENDANLPKKPILRFNDSKTTRSIGPFGWCLLIIPAVTFCLGTWQVRRKAWKEQLIAELHRRRDAQPVALPNSLDNLTSLEYYPVHVRGHFLHDRQMFLGPRTLLVKGGAATEGNTGLVSHQGGVGYLIVTPFQLEGRKEMVLVNRGWVPERYVKNKKAHHQKREKEEPLLNPIIDVIGLLRLSEKRPPFMPRQQSSKDKSLFTYREVADMALLCGDGCSHVYLDATDDHQQSLHRQHPKLEKNERDVGCMGTSDRIRPISNQTRVTLRNEHLGYVFTWYALSATTGLLWYRHFLIK